MKANVIQISNFKMSAVPSDASLFRRCIRKASALLKKMLEQHRKRSLRSAEISARLQRVREEQYVKYGAYMFR